MEAETPGAGERSASWFFENAQELFSVLSPEGPFLHVNPAWEAITGWTAAELIGTQVLDRVHPDLRAITLNRHQQLLQQGYAQALMHFARKGGGWLWLEGHTRLSPNGEMIGVLRDTSEERLRDAALEQGRTEARMLSHTAGVGLWSFDARTGVLNWSAEWSSMLSAAGIHMDTVEDFMAVCHADDLATATEVFTLAVEQGQPGVFDHRIRRGDGTWMHVRAHIRAEAIGEGLHIVHGISQDITELAEARDAALLSERRSQAAAEAKSQFLANMSHEIRTPMNGVLGVLHLLSGRDQPAEARSLLSEALACGAMLQALLDDVVDFSKIEAGMLELAREAMNPALIVEGVAGLLRPQAQAKDVALTVEVGDLPAWVMGDSVRLRQALFNLIGNAVKFTGEGSVRVVATTVAGADGPRLRFEIIDTGVGISAEAQALLFNRFQQADASTTRRFGGSGLGLAISRKLAQLMGGDVGLSSAPGAGSTFWMEIAAAQTAAPAAAPAGDQRLFDGLRILVVEDNATNRMIATKMLESMGASVATAEDGERGIEAAAVGGFDLVLMDIQMPGIDGVEATRRLRELPQTRHTPIVALTANAMTHQRDVYIAAGMSGVVSKPISPAALIAEISRLAAGVEDADAASAAA